MGRISFGKGTTIKDKNETVYHPERGTSPFASNSTHINTSTPTTQVERVQVTERHFDVDKQVWEKQVSYKEVETPITSSDNLVANNTDINTAEGENDSKINAIEENYLSGTLSYIATPETIRIRPGDTITLLGLGKYLSGDYYVQDVTRNISASGYTHSATVYKTDFGTSLKSDGTSKQSESKSVTSSTPTTNEYGAYLRAYTICKGDTYYSISKKFNQGGIDFDSLIDKNTNEPIDSKTELVVGQVIIIN